MDRHTPERNSGGSFNHAAPRSTRVRRHHVAGWLCRADRIRGRAAHGGGGGDGGGATTVATGVTRALARYVVSGSYADVPAAVRKEARRTLLNWVGCAVGGSRHETLDAAIGALKPFSGPPQASVLGRRDRMDMLHAALMNGISSHVFDFDDTHLKTVIHPAGPVVSALLALARAPPAVGHGVPQRDGGRYRGRMPHRQRRLSRPLRPRLAHHRHGRRVRGGGGLRQARWD